MRLKKAHRLRGKLLAAERLHVTLHFLGNLDALSPASVERACEAARSVIVPAFRIELDRAMSFTGRQPYVLRVGSGLAPLQLLWRELGVALAKQHVEAPDTRPFTPHLTLLYGDRLIEEHPVSAIPSDVCEFFLVKSYYGEGRHETLGRWSLRAPAA